MKFLCIPCDEVMSFSDRDLPGDGTITALFRCGACDREMAMLTNPMETQLVTSLGVEIGGRTVPEQPLQQTRSRLDTPRDNAFSDDEVSSGGGEGSSSVTSAPDHEFVRIRVTWSPEATDRLGGVPRFVRGMVKRIYTDYAQEKQIEVITPDVMDRARSELGLEGM
ncbi:MAG: PCP reductase family protein [Gemmatimonadota bacterium]|nr:PCP reductase family protein [Gemmatimonadota bacterium]